MPGIFYKTVFVWHKKKLYIFYKYKGLGLVPTGIDFTWHGKQYSTIQAMNVLSRKPAIKADKPYVSTDWYNKDTGEFFRNRFVAFLKTISCMPATP